MFARGRWGRFGAVAVMLIIAATAASPATAQREAAGWELRLAHRIEVAAGATAPLAIAIAIDRGLVISKDAAIVVDLDPDAGVSVKKKRLGRGDAVDPEADAPRFSVNVRGERAGDHAIRLHVRFWLCGTHSCRPVDVQRTAVVAVGAATPAPAPGPTPAN